MKDRMIRGSIRIPPNPHYDKNAGKCHGDEQPCVLCGKPINVTLNPHQKWLRLGPGSRDYAIPMSTPDQGGAEMGAWPVGADCLKKYPEFKTLSFEMKTKPGKVLEEARGNQLGKYLVLTRETKGLSQLALSIRMGKHQTYLSKIEKGKYIPQVSTLREIATHLDVPLSELTSRVPKTKKGYEFTAEDFGIKTKQGTVTEEEMRFLEAFRKQSSGIRGFLLKLVEINSIDLTENT